MEQIGAPAGARPALRLLPTASYDGRTNMALDAALLEVYRQGAALPTLRFYRWDVPTLSLGYGQPWTEADEARARALGVAVVRRPSGGRAVLHEGEITYCVVGGPQHGLGASIRETYCLITRGLAAGLRRMGVAAEIGRGKAEGWPGQACFQVGTEADLIWQGRKIAGSAQCRRGDGFLQHGSVLIDQDLGRAAALLSSPVPLAGAAVTLRDALGRTPAWEEVEAALRDGFREHLGADLAPGELSAAECDALARTLREPQSGSAKTSGAAVR